ncbi:MAG: HAD-IIIC family phosphatase [Synergistaceae bacterium]|nr:HAD-IIIC family phosphatase [Synergistaceae bacterium]
MLAILSNVTVTSLIDSTYKKVNEEIYTSSGYNTWVQELITAQFSGNKPEAVFLVLYGRELVGDATSYDWKELKLTLDQYLGTIKTFTEYNKDIPLFASSLDIQHDRILPFTFPRLEHKIESYWRSGLEEIGITVLEIAEIARNMGRDKFYSKRMWYLGSIPFSMSGEKAIAEEISRAWNALKGNRKKCLVLDLDNTLWGGVIGEDGLQGIELSTTKEGSRFRDFQKRIKDLKNQGVLLTIVSKNNEEDALEAIRKHPDMVLTEDDFVIIRANWEPKSVNIQSIAKELNIALDSLVFIDDNPIERESTKNALPEVNVPDFPKDTSILELFAIEISKRYFPVFKLTHEDLNKTNQYKVEQKRNEIKQKSISIEEYLESLEMSKAFRQIDETDVTRAAQLTQKTNQFNLTTRRYTESDIWNMMKSEAYQVWIGELEDKFGSYGKVILAIVKLEENTAIIDTFLMSCRVMGRNIEKDFLREIEKEMTSKGKNSIISEYIPTPKNSVVKDFWTDNGYVELDNKPDSITYKKYL